MSKNVRDRPTEGIIVIVEPNKDFHLIRPRIVKVEDGKIQAIKFVIYDEEEDDDCGHERIQQAVLETEDPKRRMIPGIFH